MTTTIEIGTVNILDIPGEYYGPYADDYDHDAIRSDYRDAIQEHLPEGVTLALNGMVFADIDKADEAAALDWDEITNAVDLDAILERHDLTTEYTIETDIPNSNGSWETIDREKGTRRDFDNADVSASDIGAAPGQKLRLRLVDPHSHEVLAKRYITITNPSAAPTVTASDVWDLHNAEFNDEAVLVNNDGRVEVWASSTADAHPDVAVITTASDVWEYCDGEMNNALAAQLATDLTRDLNAAAPATVTTAEAATILGVRTTSGARKALKRAGIEPVNRSAGRGGQNLYRRSDVEHLARNRVGRGARTDLK